MGMLEHARRTTPLLVGVVHLLPLPGSPGWRGSMSEILDQADREAAIYRESGLSAIIVENMHDVPYLRGHVHPETTAAMAVAAAQVKRRAQDIPVGVQLLAGANREALGVAIAANLDFIRVEAYAYAHVADEGILEACCGELTRVRAALGRQDIEILADVQKKHAAHALTSDLDLVDLAVGTEFCRADGLIVTGATTGAPPPPDDVSRVRAATRLPVLIGSGITPDNVADFQAADGFIVGSFFKQGGRWTNPVDRERVRALVDALAHQRGQPVTASPSRPAPPTGTAQG